MGFIGILIAISSFHCGKQNSSHDTKAGKTRWKIGMSQCNLGEPWRVQMNQDIQQAASFEYPTGGAEAVRIALDILNKRPVPKSIELPSRVFESKSLSENLLLRVTDQPTSGGL